MKRSFPCDVFRLFGESIFFSGWRAGRVRALGFWLLAALASAPPAFAAPQRVVSINLCTDQLAMLMAAPGQLHSVSFLAREEGTSMLIDEARHYVANHGQAEEVFLMQPDLVLAGTFTARASVALLKKLGFRVEQFAPAESFDDVRENLVRMGDLLERPERAAELVAVLDEGLAALSERTFSGRDAAYYYANSYTSGSGTLADAIVKVAGLANLGEALGFAGMARLPLELLVLADPDLVIEGDGQYSAPALARENLVHPAFRGLSSDVVPIADKYMICGGPFTLEASRILQRAASGAGGAQ